MTANALKTNLLEQAHANRWINAQWWKALERHSVADMDQPQSAFFGSIWGTWNHILLADRSWLQRFTGKPFTFQKLSDRLWNSKEDFWSARTETDQDWIDAIAAEPDVERVLVYRNTSGTEFRTPYYQALQHLLMHQAHHRAQIHQMCDERKIPLPDGGLLYFYLDPSSPRAEPGADGSGLRTVLMEQAKANRWINQEWWNVLKGQSLAELDKAQGAFFGSIFGTWNHILLVDRLWLGRVMGRPHPVTNLSDRVASTVDEFLVERAKTDQALLDQVVAEPDLARAVRYRTTEGTQGELPVYRIFQHMFHHQAHHRGTIHQMCGERKIALPDGGLILYYRSR